MRLLIRIVEKDSSHQYFLCEPEIVSIITHVCRGASGYCQRLKWHTTRRLCCALE